MSRTVFCRKYQKDMDGLEKPPYPGPKGQDLYDNVSKQAWQEWLHEQTMLINEKHLNVMDPQAKTFLDEQRDRFLNNESYEKAEGYTPVAHDANK